MLLVLASLLLSQANAPHITYTMVPQPMAMPADSIEESIPILVEKIAKHGPDAGPALTAALKACGFTIIGKGKLPLIRPDAGRSNGLAIEDYEVLGILNADKTQPKVPFRVISDVLTYQFGKDKQEIHRSILDSLREGHQSSQPQVRCFSLLLNELAMSSGSPWCFLEGTGLLGSKISQKNLEMVEQMGSQMTVINDWMADQMGSLSSDPTGKKAQDFTSMMQSIGPLQQRSAKSMMDRVQAMTGQAVDDRAYGDKPLSMLMFLLITRRLYGDMYAYTHHLSSSMLYASTNAADSYQGPTDYTGTCMDLGSLVVSNTFGIGFWEQIGAKGFNDSVGKVSTYGAYAKLIMSYMFLNLSLEPDDLKLTRRKDRKPGEPKKLTFTIKLQNKMAGANKIIRPIAWAAGGDIEVPDDGPVQKSNIHWDLIESGDILDKSVQFVDPEGAGSGKLKINTQTNSDGQAVIGLQTKPQTVDIPANAQSYKRDASVRVEATLKGNDIFQDMVDAASIAVAGFRGGLAEGIKTALPEMIQRTTLFSNAAWPVEVTDWSPPLWEGTFTMALSGEGHYSEDGATADWHVNRQASGNITSALQGITLSEGMRKQATGPYMVLVESISNVNVNDNCVVHGDEGGCGSSPFTAEEIVKGPVPALGYGGYKLCGGSFTMELKNVGGKDVRIVKVDVDFNFPCKMRIKRTRRAPVNIVTRVPISIKFEDSAPPNFSATNLSGSGEQDIPFEIYNAKGVIHATFRWKMARRDGT